MNRSQRGTGRLSLVDCARRCDIVVAEHGTRSLAGDHLVLLLIGSHSTNTLVLLVVERELKTMGLLDGMVVLSMLTGDNALTVCGHSLKAVLGMSRREGVLSTREGVLSTRHDES